MEFIKNRLSVIGIFVLASFTYGVMVGKYEVFPYSMIKTVKYMFLSNDQPTSPQSYKAETVRMFEHFSPKADVAFIGDSITNGGRWSEFFPNLNIVNRGVDGDKTSDILERMDSILSTSPTSAFVMVGINDIRAGLPVETILENYESIVDLLRSKNIEVVLQQTIQCDPEICGIVIVESVNSLNEGLSALAKRKGVSLLLLGELSDKMGLGSKFTYDGIHLSAAGYIYWVDMINSRI